MEAEAEALHLAMTDTGSSAGYAWFRQIFDASPDPTWIIEDQRFIECNEAAVRFLGYPGREQLLNTHPAALSPPRQPDGQHSRDKAEKMIALALQQGLHRFEWLHSRYDGSVFLAEVTLSALLINQHLVLHCVLRDISGRRQLEQARIEALDQLEKIASQVPGVVFQLRQAADGQLSVPYASAALRRIHHLDPEEVRHNAAPWLLTIHPEDRPGLVAVLRASAANLSPWQTEYRLCPARLAADCGRCEGCDIGEIWLHGNATPQAEVDGSVLWYGFITDVTARKAADAHVNHMAHHDALTGLFNRSALMVRLEQHLQLARREQHALAVLFLDLDRFKSINDTLGHAAGDALLVEVAQRLNDSVRSSDTLARLGGDEFVIVLNEVTDDTVVQPIADKILHALGMEYCVAGQQVHTTPSIGLAMFPADGEDSETLMKHADAAMYHAKSLGRNNIQRFSVQMNLATVQRARMEHDLRLALAGQQFELFYQAQVAAGDERVVAVEALLRWRSPQAGLVMPLEFIQIAEESGLIIPLGAWVIDEACRQLQAWQREGLEGVRMAVNVSALQLRAAGFLETVAEALARHGIGPGELELEITESMVMDDTHACIRTLEALRAMGVRLAIDDFGTGYSSLSVIKLMPIDTLKIDRTFVRDIETDSNDVAICTATIALAHNLGLSVVAEGVENHQQRDLLLGHGCDYLQGYLYSRPLDALSARRLLLPAAA